MRNLTYVILLIYLANTAGETKHGRILGGRVARKDLFVSFAQLNLATTAKTYTCGASLIHEKWLVSAGHCFYEIGNLEKLADEDKLKVYMATNIRYDEKASTNFIKKVHFHPHFEIKTNDVQDIVKVRNDIALALLKHAYRIQKSIRPIFLPKPIQNIEKWMSHCTPGIAVGVGVIKDFNQQTDPPVFGKYVKYGREYPKTAEEILKVIEPDRYMSLDLFPYKIYKNSDASIVDLNKTFFTLTPWHKGHTMPGDSGGPFVCYHRNNPVLYGIVSAAEPLPNSTDKKYMLGLKERIDVHLEFILSMVPNVRIYHGSRKLTRALKLV